MEETTMTTTMALETANAPAVQAEAQTDTTTQQAEAKVEKTFTQAEVNRIINQRLARLQADAEARVKTAREEGRSEAEKLAKMSEEQRLTHEREQAERAARERENALKTREAEITRRELRAEAIETLTGKGLPKDLHSILDYSSADACSQSIDVVEKAFRRAVQEGIDERLRKSGVRLPTAGGDAPDYNSMSDDEYYATQYKKDKRG